MAVPRLRCHVEVARSILSCPDKERKKLARRRGRRWAHQMRLSRRDARVVGRCSSTASAVIAGRSIAVHSAVAWPGRRRNAGLVRGTNSLRRAGTTIVGAIKRTALVAA